MLHKLKLPLISGLILGGLDLAFWIFFLAITFLNGFSLAEGLMVMMIFHAPASILLPLFGSTVMGFMRFIFPGLIDTLWPQTIFLLVVGVAQYFCLGYLIGLVTAWLRRRLGFAPAEAKPSETRPPGRLKIWFFNLFYIFFTISVLNMMMEMATQYRIDPDYYKLNFPAVRHWLELGLVAIWLLLGFVLVRFNSKSRRKFNRGLLTAAILILIIYPAVFIPKLTITDIPEVGALEGMYAGQQAGIFFDNPLERLAIMKTAVIGADEQGLEVMAYTFFGLPYRTTDISRVSDYEMRLLLNPHLQRRQHEAQSAVREILGRIKHPNWPRLAYSELIQNKSFGAEKLQTAIPGLNDANSLFLKTDYREHEVYLMIYLEDSGTNAMKKTFTFDDPLPQPVYIYNAKDIKIAKAHQPAALHSYRIYYKGPPYFMIMDVLSDQPMPADIDHIWRPDHNIRQDDIEYILKSILGEAEKNNYFDEDLGLSFRYPDNFYIATEDLGPNYDIVVTPFAPDDPNRQNPEGFIYTSLKMKKVAKGEEYKSLLNYFHEKAQDRELCPNYEERDMEINGNEIKLIKFTFGFSGGLDVNYLFDAGDYVLHVTFYNDTLYADEYGEITESLII